MITALLLQFEDLVVVHKDFRVDWGAFNGLNILMAKSELDSEREEFLLLLSNATARRKTGIIANLEIQTHTRESETGDRRFESDRKKNRTT